MILPAWMSIHVVGYGLASGVIVGAGAYAFSQHDGKIHAEEQAKAAYDRDTLRTRLMQDAIDRASARVDTVIVATRSIIQPTKILIDSATRHVTDTMLVKAALAHADTVNKACLLLAQTCDDFKAMAKDSLRVMGILLTQSNQRAKQAFAPPPAPRLSIGLSAGVGYCVPLAPPYSGRPCIAATVGGHLRIF